jgi:putative endonuclease
MPSITTPSMFYTYVLESIKDSRRYVGYSRNLRRRLDEHKGGVSRSTQFRQPLKLIYYEACLNMIDAKRRERYLKTTQGRRFLGLRLKGYLHHTALGSGS